MICPQTQAECNLRTCGMLRWCAKTSRDPSPPPPTLADIERLVDALKTSYRYGTHQAEKDAEVALMAAIKNYGAKNGQT